MSSLTGAEKRALEKAFGMSSGYVLNFSNRTFSEFVFDETGRDIYSGPYSDGGMSKANHLRTFWRIESDQVVGRLTEAMAQRAVVDDLIDAKTAESLDAIVTPQDTDRRSGPRRAQTKRRGAHV